MRDALFAYTNWQGVHRLIKVRQCRDVERVRVLLEGMLGTSVTAR